MVYGTIGGGDVGEYHDSLYGFIDVTQKLDDKIPFSISEGSFERIDEKRISLHIEKSEDHPAGSLIIEKLSESRYFYVFKPGDGEQYDACITLAANSANGDTVQFSVLCEPLTTELHLRDGNSEWAIVPVKDGEYDPEPLREIADSNYGDPPYDVFHQEVFSKHFMVKMVESWEDFVNGSPYGEVKDPLSRGYDYITINGLNYAQKELVSLMEDDPNLERCASSCASFAASFGASGPGTIPFTIEDGIEPASAENGMYTFDIKAHPAVPDGQLIIKSYGDSWEYSLAPENANLNYDFEMRLNAIGADGASSSKILQLKKDFSPEVMNREWFSWSETQNADDYGERQSFEKGFQP